MLFSQLWLPTVHDVLHADWQDVWHSPQPPLAIVFFKVLEVNVLTRFIPFPPLINNDLAGIALPGLTFRGAWSRASPDAV